MNVGRIGRRPLSSAVILHIPAFCLRPVHCVDFFVLSPIIAMSTPPESKNSTENFVPPLDSKARALYARAAAFNSRTPPPGSLPLFVEDDVADRHLVGLLVPVVQDMIRNSELSRLFDFDSRRVVLSRANGKSIEETLALAARTFHDAGYFFQWRNELLDVVDLQTKQPIASAERGLFRFFGMATQCVYAVGALADGRIYMCRRSLTKQVDPGLWDCLAAGLVAAGETPERSVTREIAEEAGLAPGEWRIESAWSTFPVRRPVEEGWMHEDAAIIRVTVTVPAHVHNTDGEVMAIELRTLEEVLERIDADQVPSDTAIAFLCAAGLVQECLVEHAAAP